MRRRRLTLLVLAGALSAPLVAAPAAQADSSHSLIQGSGSSWSSNAVNQWIADVQPNGLQVVFTASGSAQGRKDFAYKTTDFAVSDIGYQGVDKVTGDTDTSQGRGFAYLPIVAGGTSFTYQIKVGGKLVRDLRLSGETVVKIFTNAITNWNDPAVTADNNGRQLPSIPIIPVVHSEGSGSTAQMTRYFDTAYPGIWRPYLGTSGFTEYYPRKGKQIAQNGSDGVMNYVSSAAANGAIGYDEYSYALAKNYPVAKLLNKAGYYTLPTQYNVAVALTQAQINTDKSSPDYLLQNLDRVYSYDDKRTYPMSSYSYAIVPTAANDQTMTTAKRQTLTDYLYYAVCQGQREVGPIGYSPLPINLVQASFDQVGLLKQADPAVDLTKRDVTTCNNPTFIAGQPTRNYLAETAPLPPDCDKTGAGPCADGVTPGVPQGKGGSAATGTGAAGGTAAKAGASGNSSGSAPAGGTSGAAGAAGATASAAGAGVGAVDPETGAVANPGDGAADGGSTSAAVSAPVELANYQSAGMTRLLTGLAVALLLLVVIAPPLVVQRTAASRRRARDAES